MACPFCGNTSWVAATEDKNDDLIVFSLDSRYNQEIRSATMDLGSLDDVPSNPDWGQTLVAVRCQNCQYTAHFDLRGIQEEVKKWDK